MVANWGELRCGGQLISLVLVLAPPAVVQAQPPAGQSKQAEQAEPLAEQAAPSEQAAETNKPTKVEVTAKNAIYPEFLGSAMLWSLNYERRFGDFNLRVGASVFRYDDSPVLIVPMGFNYIGVGRTNHHLELGLTVNVGVDLKTGAFFQNEFLDPRFSVSPLLGYRFQRPDSAWTFRLGLTTVYFVMPWPYVSLGRSF